MPSSRSSRLLIGALTVVLLLSQMGTASAKPKPPGRSALLPIVFVHGQSGSAQQFETQAMRFTSNGYPQELLYAFEYDTTVGQNPYADLDAFIDDVLAETGAPQVYAIGHSRGTSVWTSYLFPDEAGIDGSPKVAKYVNIDGRAPAELPGGVPTVGIWGEWNPSAQIGPDPAANFHFNSKSHTEVATSAEAFAVMFEFLTGAPPATTDVVPEPPGQVTVAGKAVIFPENQAREGSTVEVWRIDPASGQRLGDAPTATFAIDETGEWGPVKVNSRHRYEFAIVSDAGVHHTYPEPIIRSDHFLRLNTSLPGSALDSITPDGPDTTNLVIVRMRELWGDQGSSSDSLTIDGLEVLTPAISPRSGVNLALFAQDDGLDGVTDLSKGELFPFGFVTFITAADVSTPASPDASGVITVVETPRGGGEPAVTNVPNWPSDDNPVTVQFRDFDQPDQTFPWKGAKNK